jgi:hypothetical protein
MTPKQFAVVLTELSQLLGAEDIKILASVFENSPEKTTAATLKKLNAIGEPGLTDLASVLFKASTLAKSAGAAKCAVLVETLATVVSSQGGTDAHAFATAAIAHLNAPRANTRTTVAARPDVVNTLVARLEERLGDDAFTLPYRELEHDQTISNAEVVAIARIFTNKKPASRPKALQAIWARHHALLVSQAKTESRGGRSAA